MRAGLNLFLLSLGFVSSFEGAWADSYTYTILNVPGVVEGINNSGQIVTSSGVLESSGAFTRISVPGSTASMVLDINDVGQTAGVFSNDSLNSAGILSLGFLGSNGAFTTIDPIGTAVPVLSPLYALATGINNAGQVVGYYSLSYHTESGFLYNHGVINPIDLPGKRLVEFRDINNIGQILLLADDDVFIYQDGVLSPTHLDLAGLQGPPVSLAINDAGVVAGRFYDAPAGLGVQHGFLYANGVTSVFDFPGAAGTSIAGVNNAGQLVGTFSDAAGNSYSFLATPVPEPASLLLSLSGLCIIGFPAWNSRKKKGRRNPQVAPLLRNQLA